MAIKKVDANNLTRFSDKRSSLTGLIYKKLVSQYMHIIKEFQQ
jgi:hypothetical protein